jgi:adenylate kinase
MIIIVSGSVGTGKTTLSKKLAKKLNYKYINVVKLIKEKRLRESYDRKRKTYVVDVKKLNPILIKIIKVSKNLVIDSHLSHYLPKKYANLCIITKCDLKILEKRLKKKEYNKEKIRENLDCEIFDICLNEATKAGHKILIVDTTKGININKLIKKIK